MAQAPRGPPRTLGGGRGSRDRQTGCIYSHWLLVMPTIRLGPDDRDYAVVAAVPVDAPGITENMTLGCNAVGYLTESMHGAGSPQAQRVQIARAMDVEAKKRLARTLAGIEPSTS